MSVRAVGTGPLADCGYETSTGDVGRTDSEGKLAFVVDPGSDEAPVNVTIGGNAGCTDAFTGQALKGTLSTRVARASAGEPSTAVATLLSTVAVVWDDRDQERNMSAADEHAGAYFGLGPRRPTTFDHIGALSEEATKASAVLAMSRAAMVDAVVRLGAAYINEVAAQGGGEPVTEADAASFVFESFAEHGRAGQGSRVFNFSAAADTVEVLTQALDLYDSYSPPGATISRRGRSLQQASADLGALADVMLAIFQTVEAEAAEGSVAKVVEEITKTTIVVETEVLREVHDLAAGKVGAAAFAEANSPERIQAKVEAAAVPTTFAENLETALSPGGSGAPPAPAPSPEPEKDGSSSGDDSGLIVGVVLGALAAAGLIAGGALASAKRARKKRKLDAGDSLPMTIDLSNELYTPYNKGKREKKAKKYAPAESALEMTSLGGAQASALTEASSGSGNKKQRSFLGLRL